MMKHRFLLFLQIIVGLAVLTATSPAHAQGTREGTPQTEGNLQPIETRLVEKRSNPSRSHRDPSLVSKQREEDFRLIQASSNELGEALVSGNELNLKFLAKSTLRLHHRAARLLENMDLPDPTEAEKRYEPVLVGNSTQLKRSLMSLVQSVTDFVQGPVFKESDNAQFKVQARLDLREIIELSSYLSKRSEQLQKAKLAQ